MNLEQWRMAHVGANPWNHNNSKNKSHHSVLWHHRLLNQKGILPARKLTPTILEGPSGPCLTEVHHWKKKQKLSEKNNWKLQCFNKASVKLRWQHDYHIYQHDMIINVKIHLNYTICMSIPCHTASLVTSLNHTSDHSLMKRRWYL